MAPTPVATTEASFPAFALALLHEAAHSAPEVADSAAGESPPLAAVLLVLPAYVLGSVGIALHPCGKKALSISNGSIPSSTDVPELELLLLSPSSIWIPGNAMPLVIVPQPYCSVVSVCHRLHWLLGSV